MSSGGAAGLRGRRRECAVLDQLIATARAGSSGVLVLRGEAGIGKSALLEYAMGRASGFRVTRATGVESEMELAFAGLHQLCGSMLGHLDRLPGPQRDALATAFGLQQGPAPDRFLVGLAVLSLFADVAEERPLLCVIDDVHWLDQASAQTLAFVGRRLAAESVVLLFAVRDLPDTNPFSGVPELVVRGLVDADARAMLRSVVAGPLDEEIRDRIVAETHGNPLALLELPRGLSRDELAGGFGLPTAVGLSGRIEESFHRRLVHLPEVTRRLLVVAAAEPVGDPVLVWRAAELLGVDVDAAPPAVAAGLVDFARRVRFRHPLVRSAVYRAASPEQRREVHRALAVATDSDADPDRRVWHRAHATSGPDEAVADELERSAGRAQTRGGLAAAAAFLEEAVRLTPDPARRGRRALDAADAKHQAGASEDALSLLAIAQAQPLDELGRARVDVLRAEIAFATRRGNDAPPLLVKAARQLENLDAGLSRETYLEAFTAAVLAGRLARGADVPTVSRAARGAPSPPTPRAADLLLDGLATLVTEGRGAGTPLLKRALTAFRGDDVSTEECLRWLWLAGRVADDLWEDETWEVLCSRHVALARQTGALSVLPIALRSRIFVHVFAGELDDGTALMDEVYAVTGVTGSQLAPYGAVALAAWRGRELEATELINSVIDDVTSRGEGHGLGITHHATAVLCNGLSRYEEALAAAERAGEYPDLAVFEWAQMELIEAAVRCGRPEIAASALERLCESTQASGTDWALGSEARSRALLSVDGGADRLYREAIDRLARTRIRVQLARTHLLYGEWLRREGRRVDARTQLRTAHDMCSAIGMEAFAERARRELAATGETVRKRSVEAQEGLTAQEAQIARLAASGRTNPEIGAELFISARTVEWHLRKVFAKLQVTNRRQLRTALGETGPVRAAVIG